MSKIIDGECDGLALDELLPTPGARKAARATVEVMKQIPRKHHSAFLVDFLRVCDEARKRGMPPPREQLVGLLRRYEAKII